MMNLKRRKVSVEATTVALPSHVENDPAAIVLTTRECVLIVALAAKTFHMPVETIRISFSACTMMIFS